jgi:glycosyltransferase involved in cell wall biosynthesis
MHFVAVLSKKLFNKKLKVIWFCQNIPVYYMSQNKGIFTSIKKAIEKKFIVPHIDIIIANSKFIQNEIKKYFNKTSKLIYPCIDTDFFINN